MEYKNEGFEIFDRMIEDIEVAIARKIFKVRIKREGPSPHNRFGQRGNVSASHQQFESFDARQARRQGERQEARPQAVQIKRDEPKVGRNDPCPCGSGKKYKHCCGS